MKTCVALVWMAVAVGGAGPVPVTAQAIHPSVTLMPPQGRTRVVEFTTDEGTDMSVSLAPDGTWLVFDLLGQVYRLPIGGGRAVALTENSGSALNFHPAISADGKRIAFISDRQGQNNVWVMNADGSEPWPVFPDVNTRFTEPAWAPDGRSIAAVRAFSTPGRGWHRQVKEIWSLPTDGGVPRPLLKGKLEHYESPRYSPDGKYLYYHVSYSIGEGLGMLLAGHRLQRIEIATGARINVRTIESTTLSPEFVNALKAGGYAADISVDPPAALAPALSPDGRSIAFALEDTGRTFSYRGHEFGPRTALMVRRLDTGEERQLAAPITKELTQTNAQYYYRVMPTFAWLADGRSIVLAYGGKIRRVDVATGAAEVIPFQARVHRVLSEQPRSRMVLEDSTFTSTFIQWPAGSRDGRMVAFVAAGQIWTMTLPRGVPKHLTADMPGTMQLTPAWSPDGQSIAFTTWNDTQRGHVWTIPAHGGHPVRVTTDSGEYIYPVWAPDGRSLVVTRGPGPTRPATWNGWDEPAGWAAVRLTVTPGAHAVEVVSLGTLQSTTFGTDGRVYFPSLGEKPAPAGLLSYPFPSPDVESQRIRVRSVDESGSAAREYLRMPIQAQPTMGRPVLSPDGKWVAYEADRTIFVRPVPAVRDSIPEVTSDPNAIDPLRRRVGPSGGLYHSWRDSRTVQFASGNRYVTYRVDTRATTVVPIHLRIPRPTPHGTIAFVGAKIITVDHDRVIARGTVVVRGARIVCVGECDASGADRVIDATGKVIIPGLVDVHAHHTDETNGIATPRRPASALDLAYGVTTIVDPATISESALSLKEMVDGGLVTGPRTFSSAEFVIWPGRAWGEHKKILALEDALFEVGRRKNWGAITIKNYRQSGRRQHQFIISAARKLGISVTSEGGPLFFDVGLTLDGQTGWEHLVASLPMYKDASTFFGKAGMVYSPTSIVAGHVNGSKEYFRPRQGLLDDPKYNRFMPRPALETQHRNVRMVPKSEVSFPILAEGLADMVHAGGYGAIGEHGEQMGIGSHWEIWAYAEALTPLEALKVATWDGAYFVGLQDQIGSITTGKLADLVILDADPLMDIRNTAKIRFVMKNGVLYDGDTLDWVWPEVKKYGPEPWR